LSEHLIAGFCLPLSRLFRILEVSEVSEKERFMRLHLQGHNIQLSDALHEYAARRISFAFDRIADRVREVVVRLTNVNGPRGGDDKLCQVQVRLASGGSLVLQDRDASAYRAIDRSIARIKRIVKDEIRRKRDRRRRQRWHR
jgi:putative sigma-54 modulation protein